MLRFTGSIWQEGGETRGKVNFIAENDDKPTESRYFKSFEALQQIIEQEYTKSQK